MLTIKLMKYGPTVDSDVPTYTDGITIKQAKSVHVRYEKDLRTVLQLGDAPGETEEISIGPLNSPVQYNCAYIMNDAGRTVETIR